MKVLVTGGTGLIGRQLLERIAGDHEVFATTRRDAEPGPGGVKWVRQDLSGPLDPAALPDALDAVIHLAQSPRYRDFPDGAADLFAVNVRSTSELLAHARRAGASRFVLASTGGLYPFGEEPVTERTPIVAAAPYFRSKRMAELLVEDYGELLATTVLRLFFVYGPGGERTLVPRFAESILAGEEIVVDGDPGLRINPIYAGDAAAAIAAALDLERGETINVAGAEVVSMGDLVRRLASALGREPALSHRPASHDGDLVADTSLMESRLGVVPEVGLDEGLGLVARELAVESSD